jgi:hypothetical protein
VECRRVMSIDLRKYLDELRTKKLDLELEEVSLQKISSEDFCNGYELGVRDGAIIFSRALWKLLGFNLDEEKPR